MTQPLTWSLHGNDRLSDVLEKLDRTLDKLSQKLDKVEDNARMMGRAVAGAHQPVNQLGTAASDTSSHLDRLGSRLSSVGSRVAAFGAAFAAAAALAAAAAGTLALKTASANEQAAISFELLLGSAQKAQAFLAELQAFAAATPFEMPQLRTAASRLLAVGVEARNIIPLLEALGDATSGMGTGAEGIERAVTALSQMQMKTKVTAEEMLQLTEAGIPAWQALAAVLKTDVQTAMKMVERREVDAVKVFEAIQQKAGPAMQRLNGMMERQSTTLSGIWSTFKDTSSQALAKFAEPALPALKSLVSFTSGALGKALDGIRSGGSQIGAIFKGSDVPDRIMQRLRELGEKAVPFLKKAWNDLVKTISDNREGLEKLGRFIADVLIPVVGGGAVGAIGILMKVLEGVVVVAANVADAFDFLARRWLEFTGMMIRGAAAAFGWVPGVGEDLKQAERDFADFADRVRAKLDELDGAEIKIGIRGVMTGAFAGATVRAEQINLNLGRRAAGGPVWPDQVYTWQEGGTEFLTGASGRVMSNQESRAMMSRTGSGDVVGVLRVVHETPGGRVIREELLELKRQRGFKTLGLA